MRRTRRRFAAYDRQMSFVDDYLDGLEPSARTALQHIREQAERLVPDAIEGKSYGMPALRFNQRPLIGFAAAKTHLSLFPFSPQVINGVRDQLDGFALSKGTIRFSADRPIPDDVLAEIVLRRLEEITGPAD